MQMVTRIVTGATKLVSINSLLLQTGWETPSRRKKHKLTLFFQKQNGLSPDYLTSLVPATVGSTLSYPLRNASNLRTIHANSKYSNNIIDCPQCVCGSLEDTHHYLFVCQQFANLRRDLFNSVSDICHPNRNVLLY